MAKAKKQGKPKRSRKSKLRTQRLIENNNRILKQYRYAQAA